MAIPHMRILTKMDIVCCFVYNFNRIAAVVAIRLRVSSEADYEYLLDVEKVASL